MSNSLAKRSLDRTRSELSDFVTGHRRKLTPADVGLPATGRRRTAGLRREEVAAIAGVGLTWYTWFEQGRDVKVSEGFLLNVARALKLDDAECAHLFLLAQGRRPPAEAYQWCAITPRIQHLMDALTALPAYVTNLRWDVIAWNESADLVFGFSGAGPADRNLLRLMFTEPALRRRLPAWTEDAQRLLGQFRYDRAVAQDDPAAASLVDDLAALSPDFRRWWNSPPSQYCSRGVSAVVGLNNKRRNFQHETLIVDEHRHVRMTVYFPAETDR